MHVASTISCIHLKYENSRTHSHNLLEIVWSRDRTKLIEPHQDFLLILLILHALKIDTTSTCMHMFMLNMYTGFRLKTL
jgi:hypothetical protein